MHHPTLPTILRKLHIALFLSIFIFLPITMLRGQSTTLVRYDTIDSGETGTHTFYDTLFYEDFEGNTNCWQTKKGRNGSGFQTLRRVYLRGNTRNDYEDAFQGRYSVFEYFDILLGNTIVLRFIYRYFATKRIFRSFYNVGSQN